LTAAARKLDQRVLEPGDVLSLKYVHDARLSPNGRFAACVISHSAEGAEDESIGITILDLVTKARTRVDFAGRARHPRWSPDGRLLAFIGVASGASRLYVLDHQAGAIHPLTSRDSQVQGTLDWAPDGSKIAYTALVQPNRKPASFRRITRRVFRAEEIGISEDLTCAIQIVDVTSGTVRSIDVGLAASSRPAFSPCGKRLMFVGSTSAEGFPALAWRLFTLELADGQVAEVLGSGWSMVAARWSPCGERIVFAGDCDSDLMVPMPSLWVVNRDGTGAQARTRNLISNLGLLIHHDMPTWAEEENFFAVADSNHAYVTGMNRGTAQIFRVALDGPLSCESVISGSRCCLIMDVHAATRQLLFSASDINSPWELFGADLQGRNERRLTHLNDSTLGRWPRLKAKLLEFQSSDGMPIQAWHLARADRKGAQPTVLFIHGGPELSCGHVFRFDFHLLAANGYAVLMVNFRGSAGYGEPFMRAIQGDWGARAYPDYMAAVDESVGRGLTDPQRLGIWGASHGGFATCWAVGHTHRFKAALAESCVTNLATLYYLCDVPDLFVRDLGGRPDEIHDVYRSRSPLTYAHRCRTPTLLMHGEADLRCHMVEAEQFYRALHDVGCQTELVRIPGMTHMGDSTGPLAARVAQNEVLLEWFERHL